MSSFFSNSSPLNWHSKLKGLKKEGKLGDTGRDLGFIGGKVNKYIEDFKMPKVSRPSQVAVRKLAEEDEGQTIKEVVERGAEERAKTRMALEPHQGWATGKKVHKKTLKALVKEELPGPDVSAASPAASHYGSEARTLHTDDSVGLKPGFLSPMKPQQLEFSNAGAGGKGGGGDGGGGGQGE